jgi:hypothetical protein
VSDAGLWPAPTVSAAWLAARAYAAGGPAAAQEAMKDHTLLGLIIGAFLIALAFIILALSNTWPTRP